MKDWDVAAVQQWLAELHLERYAPAFATANVTGLALLSSNNSKKLEELGVDAKKDRAILRAQISKELLKEGNEMAVLEASERALDDVNRQSVDLRARLLDIDRRKSELESLLKEHRRRLARKATAAPQPPQANTTLAVQLGGLHQKEMVLAQRAHQAKTAYMTAEDEEYARSIMAQAYAELMRHYDVFDSFLVQISDKLAQAQAQPNIPAERMEQFLRNQEMCARQLVNMRQRRAEHQRDMDALGL